MFHLIILCSVYLVSCNGGKVPFITPCHSEDQACLLSSAQAALPHISDGIPDLGIPPSDPLILDNAQANEGGLDIQFKNMQVAGTKGCKFQKMAFASDFSVLNFDMDCPIDATGQYNLGGKILGVQIEGSGDFEISTKNVRISVEAHISNEDGSDGQKHWHITDVSHTYEPLEKINFRFDNLFGGNEEKAQPVRVILDHSWKELTLTIGKPIIKEIVEKAKEHINNFLAVVPSQELFVA